MIEGRLPGPLFVYIGAFERKLRRPNAALCFQSASEKACAHGHCALRKVIGSPQKEIGMVTFEKLMSEKEVPVIIADHQGIITHLNDAFTEAFEWQADDLIGELITTIIPPALQDAHHLGFSRFLTTGEPTLLNQPLDLEIVTAGGRVVKAQHFIVAEKTDGRWVFGARIILV